MRKESKKNKKLPNKNPEERVYENDPAFKCNLVIRMMEAKLFATNYKFRKLNKVKLSIEVFSRRYLPTYVSSVTIISS